MDSGTKWYEFTLEFSLLVPFLPWRLTAGVLSRNILRKAEVLPRQWPPLIGQSRLYEVGSGALLGGANLPLNLTIGVRSIRSIGRIPPTHDYCGFCQLFSIVRVNVSWYNVRTLKLLKAISYMFSVILFLKENSDSIVSHDLK